MNSKKEDWLIGIAEVMERMHCGRTKASAVVKSLNEELKAKGYVIPKRGMTYRKYFTERVYV